MHLLIHIVLFFQLAQAPFWETKPPEQWTDTEINALMSESPWAGLTFSGKVTAFLASARPIREAEDELFRRRELKAEVRADEEDYRFYITQNPGKHIVLAVPMPPNADFYDAKEIRKMEKECFVRVGKLKVRAVGHFPPTPSDPYMRLLFPRVSLAGMKVLSFGLYLPGVHKPFQDIELPVETLTYRGRLEY